MIDSFSHRSYGWDRAANVNLLALRGAALADSPQSHRRFSV